MEWVIKRGMEEILRGLEGVLIGVDGVLTGMHRTGRVHSIVLRGVRVRSERWLGGGGHEGVVPLYVRCLRRVRGGLTKCGELIVLFIFTTRHGEHELVLPAFFSDAFFVLFYVISVLLEIFLQRLKIFRIFRKLNKCCNKMADFNKILYFYIGSLSNIQYS